MSGGPWNQPHQSMRHVVWSETEAEGGKFSALVRPESEYPVQHIAALAVPRKAYPEITAKPECQTIRFVSKTPITARSLTFEVGKRYAFAGTLSAKLPDGSSRDLLKFERPYNKRALR